MANHWRLEMNFNVTIRPTKIRTNNISPCSTTNVTVNQDTDQYNTIEIIVLPEFIFIKISED